MFSYVREIKRNKAHSKCGYSGQLLFLLLFLIGFSVTVKNKETKTNIPISDFYTGATSLLRDFLF